LKPQNISDNDFNLTKLTEWYNSSLLKWAREGIPVILDRNDEAKGQVTEWCNAIIKKDQKFDENGKFLVSKKEKSIEFKS
jgi:hypothetical protein